MIAGKQDATLTAFIPGERRGSDFVIRVPGLPESVRPCRHVLLVHQHALSAANFVREFESLGSAVQHVDRE